MCLQTWVLHGCLKFCELLTNTQPIIGSFYNISKRSARFLIWNLRKITHVHKKIMSNYGQGGLLKLSGVGSHLEFFVHEVPGTTSWVAMPLRLIWCKACVLFESKEKEITRNGGRRLKQTTTTEMVVMTMSTFLKKKDRIKQIGASSITVTKSPSHDHRSSWSWIGGSKREPQGVLPVRLCEGHWNIHIEWPPDDNAGATPAISWY